MDFQKAFDTVPHKRLMWKVKKCGIAGETEAWIEAFLKDRHQRVVINGETSERRDVKSGVLQGSILGPLLFLIYINDLQEEITSDIKLYADDTKISQKVTGPDDQEKIQKDLDKLGKWSEKWCLQFHPGKCTTMTVGRPSTTPATYYLRANGQTTPLRRVTEEKDLGVTWNTKLQFRDEIANRDKKANQIMGVIRRKYTHLKDENFTRLFKALVRPHLEYAAPVWTPYHKKDIKLLEDVQRRGTRQIPGMSHLSYPERLHKLKLPSLRFRRLRGDMIETYKLFTCLYDIDRREILPSKRHRTNRGHQSQIERPSTKPTLRQNSFNIRVIPTWNSLPQHIVDAPTLDSFKKRLDRHWENSPLKFDWEDAALSHARAPNN